MLVSYTPPEDSPSDKADQESYFLVPLPLLFPLLIVGFQAVLPAVSALLYIYLSSEVTVLNSYTNRLIGKVFGGDVFVSFPVLFWSHIFFAPILVISHCLS